MAKILYQKDIERLDALNGTSNLRLMEMIVDTLCEQSYAFQFFYDLKLYGLKEAIMYLDGYLEKREYDHEQYAKLLALKSELLK